MAVHAQAQASRAHLICLCFFLLLSSSAHMARSTELDDAYDDSNSSQPPARRLYDGEERFNGKLPDCWRDMQSLQFMDMPSNSFSGEIPAPRLNHNFTLESVHLDGNNFHR